MRELMYQFDSSYILMKKKKIKKELLNSNTSFLEKRIAILGGSTTNEIKNILELFLLNHGIKPTFYESEYNMFFEDAVFLNDKLTSFNPDVVFIHTTNRNIIHYPEITDSDLDINEKLNTVYNYYYQVWESLKNGLNCIVIQNNFEYPYFRHLGNKDATDIHGRINFITKLNLLFAEYAEKNDMFFINDINYQSAQYGLDKWSDQTYWYLYKYAPAVPAIPTLAFNVSNIIKAVYGKNKKAFVLDLDNTLWGGIIGDDGVESLEIGPETAKGEAFSEFQDYLKRQQQMGTLLAIDSKNEMENALCGLKHPDNILREQDFISIKANWEPKSDNLLEIATELNIGLDSCVFVDDNPAEREIVSQQLNGVSVPDIGDKPEQYITVLDHNGFCECVSLSKDDLQKVEMYRQNIQRSAAMTKFGNYEDYLISLEMHAEIKPFNLTYLPRIVQLTNKSNQFNLTTRRYSSADMDKIYRDNSYITLYGKLTDKFGDNGVVSVIIGHLSDTVLEIDLWLMSCRVLKREMEFAMMDALALAAQKRNVKTIHGFYFPTKKNKMVEDFYSSLGFEKTDEDSHGNSKWELFLQDYYPKNRFIKMEE